VGQKLTDTFPEITLRRNFRVFDDFGEGYTTGQRWTTINSGAGTNTLSSSLEDGVLVMANGSNTNDAQGIYLTTPSFLWASNTNHVAEALIQFSEASTNNANIFVGFSSVNTASLLVNASGGMNTSFTGAGIWKQGGSLNWRTISSQSTTQTINNTTNYATAGQSGYQRLRIEVNIVNGVAEIVYRIDQAGTNPPGGGTTPVLTTASLQRPIKDYITLSSPAAMYLVALVKNGTTSSETLNIDYFSGWKVRTNFVAAT
jgi:hypothetical protein